MGARARSSGRSSRTRWRTISPQGRAGSGLRGALGGRSSRRSTSPSSSTSTGYLGAYVRGAARSDPVTGAMRKVDIGIYGDLVTANDDAVYWVASAGNRVARVSTSTGQMTASRPLLSDAAVASGMVAANATAVAVGGGSVWISMTDGSVRRIDARLRREATTIPVCRNALSLAYGEGAVWVACSDGVVRVDPASGSAVKRIALASFPRGIAAGAGSVWVTLD